MTKLQIVNNRLVPNAMEPRAAIGEYDTGSEGYTLWTTSQNPHVARLVLSAFIGIAPENKLRVIAPDLKEVTFHGAIDPHTPVAQGWLRASHRKLDRKLSRPYRPYHSHDEKQPLKRGEVAELDVEIWPTCIVVPCGYRLALSIRGKDYEYGGESGGRLSNFKNELKGCGPFLHDDPLDRPTAVFAGATTLHWNVRRTPYLLLPVIPPRHGNRPKSRQARTQQGRAQSHKAAL